MEEIIDKHKQDFDEIRRHCIICHGLDLTSSDLFSKPNDKKPSNKTRSVLHGMLSSALLNLAISIRINLYQNTIKNQSIPLNTLAASYYEDDELIYKETTIKDICDKIIHADSVSKSVLPSDLTRIHVEEKIHETIQLKGTKNKKRWTVDLCLDLFAEEILKLLDKIERK